MDTFVFFLVFGVLFLAELGDKTQLIVFNLCLEHKKSYKVGIGATLGFAVIISLGVFLGTIITEFIPVYFVAVVGGIVFIVLGLVELKNLKKTKLELKTITNDCQIENPNSSNTAADAPKKKENLLNKCRKNPYFAGFMFILIMELGDKTQIMTITFASIYSRPFEVWLGAFLALVSLAWFGVFLGSILARKIPKFHLQLASAFIFIFIGFLLLFSSI